MFSILNKTCKEPVKYIEQERIIIMEDDFKLINNEEAKQYEFHVEGYIPKIEYMMTKGGEICFTHTEVPIVLEGRGIGTQLVEKSLVDVEKKNLKLVPLCPFVVGYIRKNPEWKRIVMKGINI